LFVIRIVLESVLRNVDGRKVSDADVSNLANWNAKAPGEYEIPFTVARIVLQDFTGVPLLVDSPRCARRRGQAGQESLDGRAARAGRPRGGPLRAGRFRRQRSSLTATSTIEFSRNRERYQFLKWGSRRSIPSRSCLRASASSIR
jgi:aconitate hydratase